MTYRSAGTGGQVAYAITMPVPHAASPMRGSAKSHRRRAIQYATGPLPRKRATAAMEANAKTTIDSVRRRPSSNDIIGATRAAPTANAAATHIVAATTNAIAKRGAERCVGPAPLVSVTQLLCHDLIAT